MSLYRTYEKNPELALQYLFETEGKKYYNERNPTLFLHTCCGSRDGTRYGSYKTVYLNELQHRTYRVEWCDYYPGIFYLDYMFWERPWKPFTSPAFRNISK